MTPVGYPEIDQIQCRVLSGYADPRHPGKDYAGIAHPDCLPRPA